MQIKPDKPLAEGELELLQLLWDSAEGLTLSETHRRFVEAGRDIGYTTVQTRLDRLVEKGLVKKGKQRPAVYSAEVAPESVRATMLDSLSKRLDGVIPLVAHLVQDPKLSREDLQEIRRLLDAAEARLPRDHEVQT